MKKFIFTLMACLAPGLTQAQQFNGDWNGKLTVGAQKLTLVFHVQGDKCSMDSPDQGAKNIPAKIKKQTADSLYIEIPVLSGNYKGKKEGERIIGTFTQQGMSFPLNLNPGLVVKNRPQTPKPPFNYDTREVTFQNTTDGVVLAGTLTTPKNYTSSTPAVLLVSGSGLQNRDEELFDHKPFAVIADELARQGIASLRYDDRSVGKSTGSAAVATTEDFCRDAEAGLNLLRKEGFQKVGLIGHSEGGTIAYLLADAGKVDFLVSLAGPTVSGKDILLAQNRLLLPAQGIPQALVEDYVNVLAKVFDLRIGHAETPDYEAKVRELAKESQVNLPEGMIKNLTQILQISTPWTDYFLKLNPSEAIKHMACPALLLNGEQDLQVPATLNLGNLPKLKHSKSRSKTYPGLNHLFQHCTTGAPAEYGEIEETISPEVLSDISAFIKGL